VPHLGPDSKEVVARHGQHRDEEDEHHGEGQDPKHDQNCDPDGSRSAGGAKIRIRCSDDIDDGPGSKGGADNKKRKHLNGLIERCHGAGHIPSLEPMSQERPRRPQSQPADPKGEGSCRLLRAVYSVTPCWRSGAPHEGE